SAVADARRAGNRLTSPGTTWKERGFRKSKTSIVRPVRWKPGRRAVIELDMRFVNDATGETASWHAYARVLPASELEPRLARWQAAAERAWARAVEFVDRERSWFGVAAAPGRALSAPPSAAVRARLAAVFTSLHAAGHEALDCRRDREDLGAAQRALE